MTAEYLFIKYDQLYENYAWEPKAEFDGITQHKITKIVSNERVSRVVIIIYLSVWLSYTYNNKMIYAMSI